MPTITFTLSAGEVTRVENAYAAKYNYQTLVNGSANPETKTAFTKRMIQDEIKRTVVAQERYAAEKAVSAPADPVIT